MKRAWTQHLNNDEDKEHFKAKLKAAAPVLERAYDIVKAMEEAEALRVISEKDFEDPNWSHRQAYRNGKVKSFQEVLDILKDM